MEFSIVIGLAVGIPLGLALSLVVSLLVLILRRRHVEGVVDRAGLLGAVLALIGLGLLAYVLSPFKPDATATLAATVAAFLGSLSVGAGVHPRSDSAKDHRGIPAGA
jgi:hypothetical protein